VHLTSTSEQEDIDAAVYPPTWAAAKAQAKSTLPITLPILRRINKIVQHKLAMMKGATTRGLSEFSATKPSRRPTPPEANSATAGRLWMVASQPSDLRLKSQRFE
jgi:hypothetical protein